MPKEDDQLAQARVAGYSDAGRPLSRLLEKYRLMCNAALQGTQADFTKAHREVLVDACAAKAFLLASQARERAILSSRRSLASGGGFYGELGSEVDRQRQSAREELALGRARVKAARSAKKRRDEITLLDAYAAKRPRGGENRREIAALEDEIGRVGREVGDLEERIERREGQLRRLVGSLNSLREDGERTGGARGQGAGSAGRGARGRAADGLSRRGQ
ncbi:unnamed protein product [Ostreobium quekettii]|uniref:Uncharacterized protein n=1 Tax=Ostreobium quekettii TaxID=121088 RepID=A0A8S1ING6_9CHLO|nr:unnamed protein product [Ostreobium quekettii]|eukprot:evm.model.scf_79.7 EVM.evm.TU.scf_79.7   scf_79:55075-55951(+)